MGVGYFKMTPEFMNSPLHTELVEGLKGAVSFGEIHKDNASNIEQYIQLIEGPEIIQGKQYIFTKHEDGRIEFE